MNSKKGILVLDIDGTILNITHVNIKKIFPDGSFIYVDIQDFDTDPDRKNPNITWDFSSLNDPNSIKQTFSYASPVVSNLKIMDKKIQEGWDVCFLTARHVSTEQCLYEALQSFLQYKDEAGQFHPIGTLLKRDMCKAIGGEEIDPTTVATKKGAWLKTLCNLYPQVLFIDDCPENVLYAKGVATEFGNLQVLESLQEMKHIPEIRGQLSVVHINIEDNDIDCLVGFYNGKKYWWYTWDRDITDNIYEANYFNSVSEAQQFIESIKIGELPRQGLILHIIKLQDAIHLL